MPSSSGGRHGTIPNVDRFKTKLIVLRVVTVVTSQLAIQLIMSFVFPIIAYICGKLHIYMRSVRPF